MDGTGHRVLAPVFTACTGLILTKFDVFNGLEIPLLSTSIMSVVSVSSANWRDADLLALKPTPIITGTAKKRKSKKYNEELYYVIMSEKEFYSKYNTPAKRKDRKHEKTKSGKYIVYYKHCKREPIMMLFWAFIFKFMNIREHRGWQSHSPFIWIPFWILITIISGFVLPMIPTPILSLLLAIITLIVGFKVSNNFKKKDRPVYLMCSGIISGIIYMTTPYIIAYLPMIVLALGLGDISHIVGDSFTQQGVQLIADNKLTRTIKRIPILGRLFLIDFKPFAAKIGKMKIFKFAKASNKYYPYILIVLFLCVTLAILDWDTFSTIYKNVTVGLFNLVKFIFSLIKNFSIWLYSLLKA